MSNKPPLGLFITGTGTNVGKTYVAACIARSLLQQGCRVGVYKPLASGCRVDPATSAIIADDAVVLWEAAGQPGELERVCPQRFLAPLAPHLAARLEGRSIDRHQLRSGLHYWQQRSDVVLVEGAGGLLTPISDQDFVADLARDLGLPLIVVAANALGTINHTLLTVATARSYAAGLAVAGVVLNNTAPPHPESDPSCLSNEAELRQRCIVPVVGHLEWRGSDWRPPVDWLQLATGSHA